MRWRGLSGTACPVRRPSPWWTVTRSALSVAFVFEPVIGHIKTDGHLGRCYLKGREGDAANVVLTAINHNRVVLAWLKAFLHSILLALCWAFA